MTVIFEFMGDEPIENVITCMNYKVDKVIFFGYQDVIDSQQDVVESFLRGKCGVGDVAFKRLPDNNLQSVLETMRDAIEDERGQGNEFYFDITGGESLILVAFGILSNQYETPMHLYHIEDNELIELEEGAKRSISENARDRSQRIELDLDSLVKLHGGIINNKLQKQYKEIDNSEFASDVDRIWDVTQKHSKIWNLFSNFLKVNFKPNDNLYVAVPAGTVISALNDLNSKSTLMKTKELNAVLDDLESANVIRGLVHADGRYSFSYKTRDIWDCLRDSGSILELYIFQQEKKKGNCTDCRVGVHLDWDGVIENNPGKDVLNEIDVLTMTGNIPAFISCKNGRLDADGKLHALYELETIAQRFGGKYARKVLVVRHEFGAVYLERAEEMGIEVRLV